MKRGRKKKITRKTRNEYRYLTAQIKKKLQHLSPSILWLFCEFIRLEPPCDKVEHRDALGHADSWRMVTCRQDRPRKVNNEQTSSSFSILILGDRSVIPAHCMTSSSFSILILEEMGVISSHCTVLDISTAYLWSSAHLLTFLRTSLLSTEIRHGHSRLYPHLITRTWFSFSLTILL